MVPLADELDDTTPPDTAPSVEPEPTTTLAEAIDPEIDLREADRPTAECPQCAGQGRRDLFDRFSQVEFYSCDHCMHMWQQDHS